MYIEEMSIEDLVEYVAETPDCNFVGVAITPWHAHGIDCAIDYYSKKHSLKGIICINKHRETGYALDKSSFYNLGQGEFKIVRLVSTTVFTKKFRREMMLYCMKPQIKKKGQRTIITVSADHPWISFATLVSKRLPNVKIHYYVADEGLATYMSEAKQDMQLQSYNYFKRIYCRLKRNLLNKMKNEGYNVVDGKLFLKKGSRLLPNVWAIEAYKKIIQKGADRVQIEEYSQYANAIIISTQLYNETGDVADGIDIGLIQQIYEKLVDDGEKVIVKLHPRTSDYSVYDQIMNIDCRRDFSQEVIFCGLEQLPKAVISFTSTSLVTAKLFWGLPCFSLVNLIEKSKLSSYANNEFEAFKNEFSNVVDIVTDLESLLEKIKKV